MFTTSPRKLRGSTVGFLYGIAWPKSMSYVPPTSDHGAMVVVISMARLAASSVTLETLSSKSAFDWIEH